MVGRSASPDTLPAPDKNYLITVLELIDILHYSNLNRVTVPPMGLSDFSVRMNGCSGACKGTFYELGIKNMRHGQVDSWFHIALIIDRNATCLILQHFPLAIRHYPTLCSHQGTGNYHNLLQLLLLMV